jgi:YjbE family integral membrane protein
LDVRSKLSVATWNPVVITGGISTEMRPGRFNSTGKLRLSAVSKTVKEFSLARLPGGKRVVFCSLTECSYMELFSLPWWSALGTIILLDLVLAGDNALVIGMAASKLPPKLRRKAIFWGAGGAIVIRIVFALAVVWLLKIPGLLLIGGLLLLPIAYRLAVPKAISEEDAHAPAENFWAAMKTIVIADALMGVDNVLAIGGAAQGRWDLVIVGILITIPMVVWGSSWVSKAVVKWPILIAFGAAVLALTAAGMIVKDPLFDQFVINDPVIDLSIKVALSVAVFAAAWRATRRSVLSSKTPGRAQSKA